MDGKMALNFQGETGESPTLDADTVRQEDMNM